jgi:hypothetical protein
MRHISGGKRGEDMSDLIQRSDAIKALRERWARTTSYDGIGEDIGEECEEVIEAIPSADRPQGEWKPVDRTWGRETWYCTNCEDAVVDMPTCMGIALYKYCPNCGAKMKGADDE